MHIGKYLKDYFFLYLDSNYRAVPEELYFLTFVILCISAVLLFTIGGIKKGLHAFSLVVLIEIVFLILCATVLFRESSENRDYSLMPFWSYMIQSRDMQNSMYIENLMNVLGFIPMGFFLGCTYKNIGWRKVLAVALCLSVGIEILQYIFRKGYAEVDDVMHNVLGCMIGYGLYSILRLGYEKISKRSVEVL